MANLTTVLKHEISRLARKEVRSGTEASRKAATRHRHDIAELKRQIDALSKQVTYLQRREKKKATAKPSPTAANGKRFSPSWLKSHRSKLGLSAADYALLVGVTGQSIYNWESGTSKPRQQQLASLVEVRGLGKREALRQLEELES